jgi:hypothetical protein
MRLVPFAIVCATIAACADGHHPAPTSASLGGDAVALVGSVRIDGSLVARVAAARRVDARAALGRLIDDALAAEGARAGGLDRRPAVAWALRVALARVLSDRVREAARALGPPTDAEIADLTARHWYELDTPEQLRVIHAVVLRKEGATAADDDRARALATELGARVEGAPTAEEFERRARAVPAGGFTVKVERLPPITADGRIADPSGGEMDRDFTRGAFVLGSPGSTSSVVPSKFGWHVIRVLERVPARHVPLDERSARLADEAVTRRARDGFDRELGAARAGVSVEIASDADAVMASIPVEAP